MFRSVVADYIEFVGDHVCGLLDSIPDWKGNPTCFGCRLGICAKAFHIGEIVRGDDKPS